MNNDKFQNKFVKVPMLCFQLHHVEGKRITLAEYKIIELVLSYMKNGLKMQTIEIAFVISIADTTVSTILTKLQELELIKIENRNKGTGNNCEKRIIWPTENLLNLCQIEIPPHLTNSQESPLTGSQGSPLTKAKGTLNHVLNVYNTNESYVNTNEKDFDCTNKNISTKAKDKKQKNGAAFEAFWSAWPKKVAKDAAQVAFEKLKPDMERDGVATLPELHTRIMSAIERQKRWRETANGEFRPAWPHPATWLNGFRWNDEIDIQDNTQAKASREEVRKALGFD